MASLLMERTRAGELDSVVLGTMYYSGSVCSGLSRWRWRLLLGSSADYQCVGRTTWLVLSFMDGFLMKRQLLAWLAKRTSQPSVAG